MTAALAKKKCHQRERSIDERHAAWTDARRQELLAYIAKVPDPVEYAQTLPLRVCEALLTASQDYRERRWWVQPPQARILVPYGLCEAGLTLQRHEVGPFGLKVLRELKKDWK